MEQSLPTHALLGKKGGGELLWKREPFPAQDNLSLLAGGEGPSLSGCLEREDRQAETPQLQSPHPHPHPMKGCTDWVPRWYSEVTSLPPEKVGRLPRAPQTKNAPFKKQPMMPGESSSPETPFPSPPSLRTPFPPPPPLTHQPSVAPQQRNSQQAQLRMRLPRAPCLVLLSAQLRRRRCGGNIAPALRAWIQSEADKFLGSFFRQPSSPESRQGFRMHACAQRPTRPKSARGRA